MFYWTSATRLAHNICQLVEMSQTLQKRYHSVSIFLSEETDSEGLEILLKAMQLQIVGWDLNLLFTMSGTLSTQGSRNGFCCHKASYIKHKLGDTDGRILHSVPQFLLCKIRKWIAHRHLSSQESYLRAFRLVSDTRITSYFHSPLIVWRRNCKSLTCRSLL